MNAGPALPPSGPTGPGDDWWEEAAATRQWEPPADEELSGYDANPLYGAPAGWQDELTASELTAWYAELESQPVIADPEAAWFAARAPDRAVAEPAGVSVFSAENAGESLGPGHLLAALTEQAFDNGLSSLSDDALVGLLRASRREAAWQDGVQLAAVAELDARRMAAAARPGWSRASEHVAEELAMALVLTGRSADDLLGLARNVARLPAVLAALLEGAIDQARAVVFATELSAVSDEAAREIAAALLGQAGSLTTGQLRIRLRALVLLLDPDAVRKRAQRARREARVEMWQELSGNGALAGRELPAADMVAADARITAIAEALQSAGAAGTLDEVRAAVFCALLAGRDPESLVPNPADLDADDSGRAVRSQGDDQFHGAGSTGPAGAARAGSAAGEGEAAARSGLAALAGSVHLTLPAATWLGWADAPGELPGFGPVDAWTARDLAMVLPEEVVAGLAAQLVDRARSGEPVRLTGRGGLLSGVIAQVLQAGLALELEEHLQDGGAGANGRNGYSAKTLRTEAGPVTLAVPRDRAGTFEPALVPKHDRRTSGISDQVVSLYASGMSVRDISRHLERSAGIEVSHDTVSRITDGCLEEMRAWQVRPLEQVYPIVFVDALVAKVRDGGSVRNKAVNIAVGVDCEGIKHVLGIWVSAAEGCGTPTGSFGPVRAAA